MLADALVALVAARADGRHLFWADHEGAAGEPMRIPAAVREAAQVGDDLGARLERAFESLLGTDGDRSVIFGADCPWLEAQTLDRAFDALERADLVLGPAADGGYTLIGLARRAPELFRGLAWGTDRVMAQTLERAEAAGLRVATLETFEDLDTPADLVRALAGLLAQPSAAPNTRLALERIGLLPPLRATSSVPRASAAP
jgi:rSAM/selenodomain-associated transferase 1